MSDTLMTADAPEKGSYLAYISGFAGSLLFTISAYLLVTHHVFSKWHLVIALLALAVAQLVVQLVCFLHLGREKRPYWNLVVFIFMGGVVLIVALGSLWIMYSLNHRMMNTPEQTNKYIQSQDDL